MQAHKSEMVPVACDAYLTVKRPRPKIVSRGQLRQQIDKMKEPIKHAYTMYRYQGTGTAGLKLTRK